MDILFSLMAKMFRRIDGKKIDKYYKDIIHCLP